MTLMMFIDVDDDRCVMMLINVDDDRCMMMTMNIYTIEMDD